MHKYRRLLDYARRQRRGLLLIFTLTVTASALAALQPWPMKLLVDHVLGKTQLPPLLQSVFKFLALNPTPGRLLAVVTFGGLALFALNSLLEAGLTWAWTVAGRRMVYDLAEDLFARLQRRSLLFHSGNSVGDTLSRITRDSWCVHQVIDTLLFAPAHALLTMSGMIL